MTWITTDITIPETNVTGRIHTKYVSTLTKSGHLRKEILSAIESGLESGHFIFMYREQAQMSSELMNPTRVHKYGPISERR